MQRRFALACAAVACASLAYVSVAIALAARDAPASAAPACKPFVYPVAGTYRAIPRNPQRAGLLLDGGGTDVDAAWQWAHDRLTGSAKTVGGNVIVLRATRDNDYDPWIVKVARFASARTIAIPPCASRSAIDALTRYVDAADIVFFAGGDQANYVIWKASALIAAVQRAYARGSIVGGTSAGLAIQGEFAYDSVAADRLLPDDAELQTADAVRNPFEPAFSFTTGLFRWTALANTITDSHFARRDRFGRLAAFMARLLFDRTSRRATIRGLGIDERSALAVDNRGMATLFMQPVRGGYVTRGAYLLTGAFPKGLARGKPLNYSVNVTHFNTNGERFNFLQTSQASNSYTVTVNGAHAPFYSRDPYVQSK